MSDREIKARAAKVPLSVYRDPELLMRARAFMAATLLGDESALASDVTWIDDVPYRMRGGLMEDDPLYMEVCEVDEAEMVMLVCEEKRTPSPEPTDD